MKRLLLPLMLLLVTGCASVRTHKEVDALAYPAEKEVPVFVAFGPNYVGYETIFVTSLNDCNIPVGAKLACNFVTPQNDHFLFEGTLYNKDPMVMDTHRGFGVPLTLEDVEFCLISDTQMK